MKIISKKTFLNKYVISLLLFILLMLFFDQNNWFFLHKKSNELEDKKQAVEFLNKSIDSMQNALDNVTYDRKGTVERIAREKYNQHKDSEDVYIVNTPSKDSVSKN